jgi:hypothetical protein
MLPRILCTGIVLATGAFAQLSSFPKPSYFRQVFQQTSTHVDLRDPVRLKDFMVDGKLQLSLKNYLELVMANNTDIQVTFLSLETPRNNITAAFGVWDPYATASFSASRSTVVATNPAQARTPRSVPLRRLCTSPSRSVMASRSTPAPVIRCPSAG